MKRRVDLIHAARSRDLLVSENTSWEDAFNVIFLSLVEPNLPADRPLVLDEYPAQIECLARKIPGTAYRERWELYVRGIEIANCYTEESDPQAVRSYFESQVGKKSGAMVPHAVDMGYARLFEKFPACSGVAIGFDRLAMVLLGKAEIGEVIAFPFSGFAL
jgi:lysyl-tRNA synthetase class 2